MIDSAPVLAAIFGLLIGSFLNVCIYRLPRDLSVVSPRSFCPECGASVAWYQNVPVLSFLLLRGRCRNCSKSIGLRYLLVEILTAVLFWVIAQRYGSTWATVKWSIFEALLVLLFWTDFEERILPDEATLGGSFLGVLFAAIVTVPGIFGALALPALSWRWQSVLNACAGGLILALPIWLIGALYGWIRKKEALGLGDVKLLALIGTFLGPENGFEAVLIGTVAGSIISVAFLLWTKKHAGSYELPFGSFLCAGAALIPLLPAVSSLTLAVL